MTHTKSDSSSRSRENWLTRTLRSISNAVFEQSVANNLCATNPPVDEMQHLAPVEAVSHLYGHKHAVLSEKAAKNLLDYATRARELNVLMHSKTHRGTLLVNISKYYEITFTEDDQNNVNNNSSLLCFQADQIPVKGSADQNQEKIDKIISIENNSWAAIPLLDPDTKLERIYIERKKRFRAQGLDEETGLPLPDFKDAKEKDKKFPKTISIMRAEIINFEQMFPTIKLTTTNGEYFIKEDYQLIFRIQRAGMENPLAQYTFELAHPPTPNTDKAINQRNAIDSTIEKWQNADDYARGLKSPPSRSYFVGHPSYFNG